jgi:hypothetical protein
MQTKLNMPSRASKHQLMKLENNVHYSSETGGIYETTKKEVEPDSILSPSQVAAKPWARWGADNNYPQRLIDAVMTDPSAALLEKRRAFHYGRGLMFYKRIIKNGKEIIEPIETDYPTTEIEDFFFENDIENFQQGIIGDFEWWHSFPIQYILSGEGKVLQVVWPRMKNTRSEIRNPKTGNVDHYYLSGNWPNPEEGYFTKVPAFNPRAKSNASGLYRHQLVSIDKDYNPQPAWHAVTRWLYIATKIPRWILGNIDNSMNIKYHVKIPIDYFNKRHPLEAYETSEKRNEAIEADIKATYDRMDKYLAGEKNVHKAFYSFVAINEQGDTLPGWEIIPLDNKIEHEAWLKAYGTASAAIISGIGLSPSIAGSILPNGLGSGSGSDLREQFNFYMQVMTAQPRQTTLEWYNIVKRRNNWPKDIHLGYRDVILQSTDQAKSGFVKPGEEAPTSDQGDNNKVQP